MKVAIQTIAWGVENDLRALLPTMAREVAAAGYAGIELFQHALHLHQVFLRDCLRENNLELIGVSGGSFKDRVEFARGYRAFEPNKPMPYIYTDEWPTVDAEAALGEGATIAIHPHMFKPIQTVNEALAIFDRYAAAVAAKQLRLLPDSAHQEISGEPILDVLKKHIDKIDNIHLKDWTPEFGRAYQFYAQGFVPLGQGDVDLEATLKFLKAREFRGWLIVEQDTTDHAFDMAKECREWLRCQGV